MSGYAPASSVSRPPHVSVDESIRRVFSTFDRDGSGDLDVRELSKALKALGLETDREATRGVMARYDADGGGKLDLEEFAKLADEVRKFQQSNTPSSAESPRSMQQSKVSTSAESPRSTTGVAVTAKPTVRIEEVIGAADVSAQALRCKEDIDRLFSFYAKLQGSGVSTGAPPTLELEEAFHMLGDFGVLASARSSTKAASPAAVVLPRDAVRTAFSQAATGKVTPNEKRDGLGRPAFWEFLLRLALSPSADGIDAASSPGGKLHALLGCFHVGQGAESMRSKFTNLRGEPAARPKPAPAAANMSGNEAGFGSRVVVSEPPLADRAAGGGGASARKGETAKFRATVSSHKRAPPLIFILHEVSLDAGVHSRNVTSLAATAGFGPADVDAPSQLAGLPRASSSASRFDPRRGCADFGWEHRWPLNADEAQVALRSTFFRYKGAVPPAIRKAFELFDKDKSGDIDTRELRPALRQLGLEGVDMGATREAMAKYDADGGGKLELLEFCKLVEDIRSFQEPSYVRAAAPRPSLPLSITVTEPSGRVIGTTEIELGELEVDVDYAQAPLMAPRASGKDGGTEPKVVIGHVLYSVNAGAALSFARAVRGAFVAADADGTGGGSLSLEAAAQAIEGLGIKPTSASVLSRVHAEALGKPVDGAIDLPTFAALHVALINEASARLAGVRKRQGAGAGGQGSMAGGGLAAIDTNGAGQASEEALADGVDAILTEKKVALRMEPGMIFSFYVDAHQTLEMLEVHNTNARILLSASDMHATRRVSDATLFDGSAYFHTPEGAPVRAGGTAWTLPGPFLYELTAIRPLQSPGCAPMQPKEGTTPQGGTPPEGGLPSTEPVYVLLRTLSRFDRSEVLTADTEHPLLAAALPRAVPFSRHVTAPTMNTQLVASHHSASPGDNDHASPAGMRSYASCDANAVAARSNPAYYTVPSAYSQLRYEQSSYAQGVSPHAQAQIAGVPPSFHVTTRPEQVPPPILPVAPLVPSAAQIDQAQKDARSRAESLRRAFEQLDVRQVGRVAVTDIIKALKSMKVQVKHSIISSFARADSDGVAGLDFHQFSDFVAKLEASGAFSAFEVDGAHALEAKAVLDRFDKDRSGSISTRELRNALNSLNLQTNSSEASQILRQFDADGSGSLDIFEFTSLLSKLRAHLAPTDEQSSAPDGALVAAFRSFDPALSGTIPTSSLRAALIRAGIDTSSALASQLIADLTSKRVQTIDMPMFRRMALAIHNQPTAKSDRNSALLSHTGTTDAAVYGDSASQLPPSANPYYKPPPSAPYVGADSANDLHGALATPGDGPPPSGYEAYLLAASAAGHLSPSLHHRHGVKHTPCNSTIVPELSSPYARDPVYSDHATPSLPHAAYAARAALSVAEGRVETARARAALLADARRAARKPMTPTKVPSPYTPRALAAAAYEAAYMLPVTPMRH